MGMMETIQAPVATDVLAREYLTFRLGGEEYGIDILKVQEIRGYENPTRIANAPAFLKGVVNLRGTIVPIVDLRVRFGCLNANGEAEYNAFTVTIVLHIGQRTVGTVVDSVSDVVEIPAEAVRPAPEMKSAIDATYIKGLAHVGERMVILLDIESLLLSGDMGLIN
jgi:purine-binding chemotaxis protein CheW